MTIAGMFWRIVTRARGEKVNAGFSPRALYN
jgi:hypothetical protein